MFGDLSPLSAKNNLLICISFLISNLGHFFLSLEISPLGIGQHEVNFFVSFFLIR